MAPDRATAPGTDLGPFARLAVAGSPLGRVVPAVGAALREMPGLFDASDGGFALRDAGMHPAARSMLLQEAAGLLRARGLVPGWRNEACELLDAGGNELARFERGAFRTLGLQNRAVHINGWRGDGRLWIARRSATKASSPNKLDNLAAGAIAAGETPADCAVRELWEEAGVPAELAALATFPPATIRSLRRLAHGVHDEVIVCADLVLPADFTPVCQDGEVAEFICMTREEAQAALATREFSVEAGLVLADWMTRNPA